MRCLAIVLLFAACGSGAPALKSLDRGDDAERVIALQDNYVTLIARSDSPLDAASTIKAYCTKHRATIDALVARVVEREGDAAFVADLQARSKPVIARLEKLYNERPDYAGDQTVAYALRSCDGRPGADAGLPKICEHYGEKVRACMDEQTDAARRETVLADVESVFEAAREAISAEGEAMRAHVAELCAEALAKAEAETSKICPSTVWE